MSDDPPSSDPPRLARGSDPVGRLLAGADAEFRRGLNEPTAFRRVERARRQRTALSWAVGVTAAAGAVLLLTRGLEHGSHPEHFALLPERIAPSARELPRAPEPAASLPVVARIVSPPAKVEALASAPTEPPSEHLCSGLVTQGKSARAVDCYRALGQGSGVGAEVALYHAARISFANQSDGLRTLALIDEHRKRFPQTSLSAEVEWLRVRSLRQAGRSDEALAASEAMLASPSGRSLSRELHHLRATIYQDERGDCARAVSELVSLVGEPGERGDDAELRRARCLEKLGRSTDARAAYQHYLERPDARHAGEARARLTALSD